MLVDTNVFLALGNAADDHHRAARELLETVPGPLVVAPTVIDLSDGRRTGFKPAAGAASQRSARVPSSSRSLPIPNN